MSNERKDYLCCPLTWETKADAPAGFIAGHGASFSPDLVGDKILPGAFAETIVARKGRIPILRGHNPDEIIGSSTMLAEDAKGLYVEAQLFLTTMDGKESYALLQEMKSADIRMGLSIGYSTKVEDTDWDESTNLRVIKKLKLWEVSITAFPANPKAYVADVKTDRDLERHLRDAGHFSRADSKRIIRVLSELNLSTSGTLGDANPNSRLAQLVRDACNGAS